MTSEAGHMPSGLGLGASGPMARPSPEGGTIKPRKPPKGLSLA